MTESITDWKLFRENIRQKKIQKGLFFILALSSWLFYLTLLLYFKSYQYYLERKSEIVIEDVTDENIPEEEVVEEKTNENEPEEEVIEEKTDENIPEEEVVLEEKVENVPNEKMDENIPGEEIEEDIPDEKVSKEKIDEGCKEDISESSSEEDTIYPFVVYGRTPFAQAAVWALLKNNVDVYWMAPNKDITTTYYFDNFNQCITIPYSQKFYTEEFTFDYEKAFPIRDLTHSDIENLKKLTSLSEETILLAAKMLFPQETIRSDMETLVHHRLDLSQFTIPKERILLDQLTKIKKHKKDFILNDTYHCQELLVADQIFHFPQNALLHLNIGYEYQLSESINLPPAFIYGDYYCTNEKLKFQAVKSSPCLNKEWDKFSIDTQVEESSEILNLLQDKIVKKQVFVASDWQYGPLVMSSSGINTDLLSSRWLEKSTNPFRDMMIMSLLYPQLM
jgi:hypothetical protein